MTCVRSVDIGPYLLGAVSAEQRLQLEEHLETCATCREEIIRLAGLPGLLWRVSDHEQHEPEPGRPLPRRDGGDRTRRRRHRRMAAVAAALVIVGGTLAGLEVTAGGPPRPAPTASVTTLSATEPAGKITATAILTTQPWGTDVRLRLRGLPYGARCELVVHGTDGSSDIAATWNAAYTPQLELPAATGIARDHIASLEIVAGSQQLITIPHRGAAA